MTIPTPDEICEVEWLRANANSLVYGQVPLQAGRFAEAEQRLLAIADLIQQQQATIERLSAELEHLIDIIDGTEATGFDPHVEQMLMDAAETGRAALGKDASDVRAREEYRW